MYLNPILVIIFENHMLKIMNFLSGMISSKWKYGSRSKFIIRPNLVHQLEIHDILINVKGKIYKIHNKIF